MTVIPFISTDSKGKPWAPDTIHEVEATQYIIAQLWEAFHHLPEVYAVIANLHRPYADLVIVTERGLGVVELKNHSGLVTGSYDGAWRAGGSVIHAGAGEASGQHINPFRQAQRYAEQLRAKLLPHILSKVYNNQPDELKFQTAVCFTNKRAVISQISAEAEQWPSKVRKPWESRFSILSPVAIKDWAMALRFGIDLGRSGNFEPFRLVPTRIVELIRLFLGGQEWEEIKTLMPTGQPYGTLTLLSDESGEQTFSLRKDTILVGRDPNQCDVVLPKQYGRSSRRHLILKRQLNKVFVVDKNSTHGTYINGALVMKEQEIKSGQILALGGTTKDTRICRLKFVRISGNTGEITATELTSSKSTRTSKKKSRE